MIPIYHQCDFCSKTFVNEKNLDKHSCDFKDRYEFITKRAVGQSMYKLYLYWLRMNGKSTKYVDQHTFIHSTHYKPFKRFIDFCKTKSIPNKKTYIKICNSYNLAPRDWSTEKTYETFLEIYDELIPVNKQIDISLDTLFQISDALEIEVADVFDELEPSDVSKLIRSRKISPWLFLNSERFKRFLIDKASSADRDHIQKSTNPSRWKGIFEKNAIKRRKVCELIKQLGL